jgi:hypothetical protein
MQEIVKYSLCQLKRLLFDTVINMIDIGESYIFVQYFGDGHQNLIWIFVVVNYK